VRLAAIGLALALASAAACDRAREAAPSAPAPAADASAAEPVAAKKTRDERPLPAFSGTTFEGERVEAASFVGRRLVVFFFDTSKPEAMPAARAVAVIAPLQGKHNFRVLGVATGASSTESRAFIERSRLGITAIDDSTGAIGQRFGLRLPAAFVLADAEGYMVGAMSAVAEGAEDPAGALEAALREQLRLPAAAPLLEPGLGEHPLVPDFTATPLAGGEPFQLASLRGRPAVLIFFLYTCPHCHAALRSLKQLLPEIPEARRPALVAISVAGAPSAVQRELASQGLDFFPVLADPDHQVAERLGVGGGVPELLLVDAQGRVRARTAGWRDDRDPALLRMRLAQIAGEPVPMLLHQTGYSGNEFCAVCHENEAETWRFSDHARAFDTLVRHGAERNDDCVSCHVVGFGKAGGYTVDPPTPHFENVGCETCHGRGGPHLSQPPAPVTSYESTCVTCHDATHSLGFAYSTFLPKVSHAANAGLLALPVAEKRARIAALGERRPALFPDADFVGSAVCATCHASEHATWSTSPHGRALASLEAKGKAQDGDCLRCHTTGYDKPGGFPVGGRAASHAALASVGCESCHGPGGDHVKEGARRAGTIVSLGDKCDSCVILQICGSCHDDANDPGFEYEVKRKIDAQRHGTIEPGTGKPKAGSSAALDGPLPERLAAVERALAATGGR
jgi:peroxiredoxin